MNIKDCLEKGYLTKEGTQEDLIEKELKESGYDFSQAKKAFAEKDYKWAIIKTYYSMFHAGKAVCFKLGYREKKHFALLIVLEELNKEGKLEAEYLHYFEAAADSRESADYRYTYSRDTAEHSLKIAALFNQRIRSLLNEL